MAGRRLSMRKIREVLRLKWLAESSARQIAKGSNIARSTVQEYLNRADETGLTWRKTCELDETALIRLLYPDSAPLRHCGAPIPEMDYLHRELRRRGVTGNGFYG